MLPTALILEIDRLLAQRQHTQREIAARVGVSHGTVNAIAKGRRALFSKEPHEKRSVLASSSPAARCRGCGYRVYMPCLICSTREYQAQQIEKRSRRSRR